jgi:hypothetical protein
MGSSREDGRTRCGGGTEEEMSIRCSVEEVEVEEEEVMMMIFFEKKKKTNVEKLLLFFTNKQTNKQISKKTKELQLFTSHAHCLLAFHPVGM